jgi:hypothetical protein
MFTIVLGVVERLLLRMPVTTGAACCWQNLKRKIEIEI